jgi:alpha-L-fucosidase
VALGRQVWPLRALGSRLYAILLGYPNSGKVSIDTLSNQTVIADSGIKRVSLLGHDRPLEWERTGIDFALQLPAGISPDEPAYVLKIEVNGKLK